MRVLWSWSAVAALALGVLVWGLIFWCCIRYRKRDDELPRQTKYNLPHRGHLRDVPFLVIVVLFWRTVVVEDDVEPPVEEPGRARPGRRVQVELAVRVPSREASGQEDAT